MADLTLDDQNLANGTTPGGPDFDDFEIVLSGYFFGPIFASLSDDTSGLNQNLIWRFEQDGTVLTGYNPLDRNAIVELTVVGSRYITPNSDGISTIGVTVRATLLDSYQYHPLAGDDLVQLGSVEVYATSPQSESIAYGTASIEISDDAPAAQDDSAITVNDVASGNVLTNDVIGADDCTIESPLLPSDGPILDVVDTSVAQAAALAIGHQFLVSIRAQNGVEVPVGPGGAAVAGQYGVLQIAPDGSWTYSAIPGSSGQDVFDYVIADCDGDSDTGALIVTIPDRQPTAGTVRAVLDDDILAGGNPGGPGDDPDPAVPLAVSLIGADGNPPVSFALEASGAPTGFTYDTTTAPGSLYILQGSTRVITVTLPDAQTGAVAITQNAPILHDPLTGLAGDDAENNLILAIPYTVTDRDGDVATGSLEIEIDDDTPVIGDDEADLTDGIAGNAISFDVLDNDSVGADANASLAFAGGRYGAVTISSDGSQSYALNASGVDAIRRLGADEQLVDTIGYTLTDGDGDSAAGQISVTLIGRNDAPSFSRQEYAFLIWDDSDTFNISATDPDEDPLDYSVGTPAPQFGTVTGGEDGQFTYQPQTTQPVVDGFLAVATDPGGATGSAQVAILVALPPDVINPMAGLNFSIF